MPEKVSPAEAAKRIAAFFYLLISLAVFPVVLMAVQDLPSLPRLTYSRYLEHVSQTHIPFETIILGFGFIGIFLVPLWRILLSSKLELSLMTALIAAMVMYTAGVFASAHVYPLSAFKSRSVCSDGYQICHTFGVYGYVMLLALTAGIAVARIGRNTIRSHMDTPPDQPRFR